MTRKHRQTEQSDLLFDAFWQDTVEPVVCIAEHCERLSTLMMCHDHLLSLSAVMQGQPFNPFVTPYLLSGYIRILQQAITELHQEVTEYVT